MTDGQSAMVAPPVLPAKVAISIIGGSGFIGRHLIRALVEVPSIRIIALTRDREAMTMAASNLSWLQGDMEDPVSLRGLLQPGGILVHLAYPTGWEPPRHMAAVTRLAEMAAEVGTKRIVLCSTAVVVGRVSAQSIDENILAEPASDYERTKLEIEEAFIKLRKDSCQLAILRPTAVLGPGGKNLEKLSTDLLKGGRGSNYLRSSLYGARRMNLVGVGNVAAALQFLALREQTDDHELYIISDDDDPLNNYRSIETELMRLLGVASYPLPPLPMPSWILALVLRLSRRSNTNPHRIYSWARLAQAGFRKPTTLRENLRQFVAARENPTPGKK
jgi:nucleoside-diphosphate-sugar epimerase